MISPAPTAPLLRGTLLRLRAPEPADLDAMWEWENDTDAWNSGLTLAPMSRHQLQRYIDSYSADILSERQLRLIAATADGNLPVGAVDLFDYDPLNARAGVGIIIWGAHRRRGFGAEALRLTARYAGRRLGLRQLWCQIAADNEASIRLFDKAGYTLSGILRDWMRRSTGFVDAQVRQLIL